MIPLIDLIESFNYPIIDTLPDSALIVRLPIDEVLESKDNLEKYFLK